MLTVHIFLSGWSYFSDLIETPWHELEGITVTRFVMGFYWVFTGFDWVTRDELTRPEGASVSNGERQRMEGKQNEGERDTRKVAGKTPPSDIQAANQRAASRTSWKAHSLRTN